MCLLVYEHVFSSHVGHVISLRKNTPKEAPTQPGASTPSSSSSSITGACFLQPVATESCRRKIQIQSCSWKVRIPKPKIGCMYHTHILKIFENVQLTINFPTQNFPHVYLIEDLFGVLGIELTSWISSYLLAFKTRKQMSSSLACWVSECPAPSLGPSSPGILKHFPPLFSFNVFPQNPFKNKKHLWLKYQLLSMSISLHQSSVGLRFFCACRIHWGIFFICSMHLSFILQLLCLPTPRRQLVNATSWWLY